MKTHINWKLVRIIHRDGEYTGVLNICDETGPVLGITDRTQADEDRAEFIVKACNSHAQLVAALEGMIEQADAQFRAGDRHATFNKQTIEQVRQALQSAKE